MESADQLSARARAERVLELVSIAPLLLGRDDRLELDGLEAPDPRQRIRDLLGLDLELALVGEHLPGGTGMVRDGRDAVRRPAEHLASPRLRVALLGLAHHRAHAVTRHCAGDEDYLALEHRAALAAVGQRV